MALKITASTLFVNHWLKLDSSGLALQKPTALGGKTRLAFAEIDYILMGADGVLSLQYGSNAFSIQTKPDKPQHRQLIDNLVLSVQATLRNPTVAGN